MKTAIEMLVEELEAKHSDILFQYPNLLSNIDKHLETEKQHIIDLCTEAYEMGLGHKEYSSLETYTSTFGTNKETLK